MVIGNLFSVIGQNWDGLCTCEWAINTKLALDKKEKQSFCYFKLVMFQNSHLRTIAQAKFRISYILIILNPSSFINFFLLKNTKNRAPFVIK
jgi:hypothetical protein